MELFAKRYLDVVADLRATDLPSFTAKHDRLFEDAKRTGDHAEVTSAYYEVMAGVIEAAYGESWHFCPRDYPGQSRGEAVRNLHRRIAALMSHGPGRSALDIGCGVGGAMRDIARYSGGQVTGLTLGSNEVRRANERIHEEGLEQLCLALQGDCQQMPFNDQSFDSAYAIYSLKYFERIDRVLAEIARVLRPGGLFVTYCLTKTPRFDEANAEHREIFNRLEYACGMPSLRTAEDIVNEAKKAGFYCVSQFELSTETPWYHDFTSAPLFAWLVSSPTVRRLIGVGEAARLLPRGFRRFNDIFLAGTVRALVDGGRRGVLSGSTVLVMCKEAGGSIPPRTRA